MKRLILLIITIVSFEYGFSQSYGFAGCYNPQTEGYGIDLRAVYRILNFEVSPQITFYPPLNKVNEVYAGASLHVPFIASNDIKAYVLANASYDAWLNYMDSPKLNAKMNNFAADVGIGIVGQHCLNPFAEFRYNPLFRETSIRVGILVDLTCGSPPGGYHGGTLRSINCPGF